MVLGILTSCTATRKVTKVDLTNPKMVAGAVLDFYQKKDLEALKYLSVEKKANILEGIIVKNDPATIQNIFSGWRWEKINQWNGKIAEVRFSENLKQSYAIFDMPETVTPESEVSVVVMQSENNQWKFDDIQKFTKKGFDSLGYIME